MKKNSVLLLGAEMIHLGPEKTSQTQTRPGGSFPKMLVFGWHKVKGKFWSILGLILFLFWIMLFGYKLMSLSFSVSFFFLVFRRIWVCLGMSKMQKRFIYGQKKHVVEFNWTLWNISWIHSTSNYRQRLKLFRLIKIYKETKQLFICRIITRMIVKVDLHCYHHALWRQILRHRSYHLHKSVLITVTACFTNAHTQFH